MEKCYILKRLKKYKKANKLFHIPGHKGLGKFKKQFHGADLDITELGYSDNLLAPNGVIAGAQHDIAELLGAYKSYILTDGSSSGIFAMLYVASKYGKKVIIPRNSHQSVWNACAVLGLEPLILQGEMKNGVIMPPRPSDVKKLVLSDPAIAGMIAVSPDYYGNIAPLSEYAAVLSKQSRLLMVDEAHGAHLAFSADKSGYAGGYADMWVDGAHKTLHTLTQGAILSVEDERLVPLVEEALSMFRTTSPSYPIMASVEYGVKYAADNEKGEARLNNARAVFEKRFPQFTVYDSADKTKFLIDFAPLGIDADIVYKILERKKIYAEFSDGRYILFYLSTDITALELIALGNKLKSIVKSKKLKNTYVPRADAEFPSRSYSYQYALRARKEYITLSKAEGKMCARNAGIAPPCVPVMAAGEIITASAIKSLSSASARAYGLEDGKILVVKE